jgi:thiol:disulfide interchange protein DsbA
MAKKKRIQPKKKSNRTLIYAGLAVLLIALLAVYASSNPPAEKPQGKLPTAGGWNKTNMPTTYEPGKVKITEFLKFDCSHCDDLHKNMPQLLKKYKDNVTITYVPIVWPGQSTKSVEAYILAEQMGKGEEMLNALFTTQFVNGIDVMESIPNLEGVAASIGLGADFNAKLEGGSARQAALANLELMNKYSVQGTPTIIINGNILVNPPTATNLDTVIGSLLS